MNNEVLAYINERLDEAHNYISSIFWVDGVLDYQYSNSDHDFIDHLNSMNPTHTKIVLIHSHGGADGWWIWGSSFLQFKDGSKLYDNEVNRWLNYDGYFIFAGACDSATYDDLGNTFLNKGFDAYFGYTDSVYTVNNARFYSAFFDKGRHLDVTISEARDHAEQQVLSEFGSNSDVVKNKIIGDSSLCLATSDW
ncbi:MULTISPECIES: C25 family cysteine peptidase [Archaeoglobus]|jgi:hypothetical protein|uniref:Uncharacterized protein AF_1758 n=2 Tax=Archaeoglobus fulgidus TaxID=2234 RepID=Y1758_ARCFU|nr:MULTISPECIES: C25 family cysteine peptidase [Archaeoglobus]O28516.1 RecName: Full=Uncharacterized protein AF_1758 [Archaeoglobus fulgidus DSM 4304]AAB89492.1 predicted coding region AF_1758 [Archaeoglobus fulgidus DSM 4304]AIG98759.1 hypothetical protein AFULGI_00020090 [Archaeoglobus fulgidus DSM 8774]MDI3498211.1 hypothetical protein [Archaeoglobus sp.]